MSTVTMTMLEALNKKKLLEERVAEFNTKRSAFIGYASEKELNNSPTKKEDLEKAYQSNFMSRLHAIKNLAEIKSKINESNAITKIKVAGVEYTIADAIARHRAIETEKRFWNDCANQYNAAITKVEELNTKARDSENVSRNVAVLTANLSKLSDEMIENLKAAYIAENTVSIIDPNNFKERLDAWRDEIDEFEAQLHGAMIESNVKTTITCNFED